MEPVQLWQQQQQQQQQQQVQQHRQWRRQKQPRRHHLNLQASDSEAGSEIAWAAGHTDHLGVPCCAWAAMALLLLLSCLPFLGSCAMLFVGDLQHTVHDESPPAEASASANLRENVLVSEAAVQTKPPLHPAAAALSPAMPAASSSSTRTLRSSERVHNNKVCGDDEELLAGLCYRRCSLLTDGRDPIRTSPWTCCQSRPCAMNQRGSLGSHVTCSGYDVAGDGSCPHAPGVCLVDEELLLGVCYKKCSLLTEGKYPHRMTPMTCCERSGLSCLDFRNDYTSKEFAVGGGESGPGACLQDEELLMGTCYKKCNLLTGGRYPHRITAATCCKAERRLPHRTGGVWHLGCLDPWQDETRVAFNTPGEAPRTTPAHGHAHLPLETPAEVQVAASRGRSIQT